MTYNDIAVLEYMEKYGGLFVSSLSIAMQHGGPANFKKLKAAFPEIWSEYSKLTALRNY